MRNPITSIGALGLLAGLSSIREVRDDYGNPFTGGPGAGWEKAKRSPAVSAMLQEKAQAKRERKAAIRAAKSKPMIMPAPMKSLTPCRNDVETSALEGDSPLRICAFEAGRDREQKRGANLLALGEISRKVAHADANQTEPKVEKTSK